MELSLRKAHAAATLQDGTGGGDCALCPNPRLDCLSGLQVLGEGHAVGYDGGLQSHHGLAVLQGCCHLRGQGDGGVRLCRWQGRQLPSSRRSHSNTGMEPGGTCPGRHLQSTKARVTCACCRPMLPQHHPQAALGAAAWQGSGTARCHAAGWGLVTSQLS